MLNPIIKECNNCCDLQKVYDNIQCTLLDLIKKEYYSLIYGTKFCADNQLYKDLVHYKNIIYKKMFNYSYPCSSFDAQDILAKATILAYKTDCSRCK